MIHMSRKTAVTSFLVICAVAIVAIPASAAGVAFQASSLPVQVRGEGLTETIGAVVLQATGPGTIPAGSSITFVYSGAIAKATTAFPGTNTNGLSCAIGTIQTGGVYLTASGGAPSGTNAETCNSGGGGATVYFATAGSGSQLTVAFNSSIAFSAGDYIEISQVRMNVNALGSATSTVTATLSGTSATPTTNPITFTQSQVVVASIVTPSIKASVATTATAIQTCNVQNAPVNTFSITVAENYPAAFTSTTDEGNFTGIYTITQGSLINFTVSNVPSGLGIAPSGYAFTTTGTNTLVATLTNTSFQVSTGSAMTWTFAITGDSTGAIESFTETFTIGLPNSAGTAFSGSNGSMAAIGTVVSATAAVSLGPSSNVVSFATNNEGGGTVATIGDCVTNLLFPFSTNQVGFDTNIQISNTSADKLAFPTGGATAQSGTCTLTYYPTDLTTQTSTAAGTSGTASQFTTPTIPAGGAYSVAQSATSFKGQSGYMFAVCRFLDAHGFSYVVNGTPSTGTISQGLLALVIPNTSLASGRLANPSATCTPGGAVGATCTVNQAVAFAGATGSWEGLVH